MKVNCLARKTFSPKKTPRNSLFWRQGIWVAWPWEVLYAKLLDPGQLLGCPWKFWGITVQTCHWEGLWHQNCGYTSSWLPYSTYLYLDDKAKRTQQGDLLVHEPNIFWGGNKRNQGKTELFRKSLRTRKFSMGKFFGASTHGIVTHSGFRKCIWKVGTTNFWPCFACPKLGDAGEMRVASKNR